MGMDMFSVDQDDILQVVTAGQRGVPLADLCSALNLDGSNEDIKEAVNSVAASLIKNGKLTLSEEGLLLPTD